MRYFFCAPVTILVVVFVLVIARNYFPASVPLSIVHMPPLDGYQWCYENKHHPPCQSACVSQCPCRLWMDSSDVTKTNTIRPARAHHPPVYLPRVPVSKWSRACLQLGPVMLRKQTPPTLPERTIPDHPRLLLPPRYLPNNGCWTTRDCCPPIEHRVPHSHTSLISTTHGLRKYW